MKIIDKTPLHDEKGQMSFIGRIQGALKYGLSWSAELDAQQNVIAQLDRILEKGFVLIRNFTLPNSEIVIPMILLGPGGVTVISVTTIKGFFEAKGDQWNTLVNGQAQPASINLLNRVTRFARAVQVYLERQKIDLPGMVEPVLIAADPGAHIESMRPAARVVMSDAVKQFGTSSCRHALSGGVISLIVLPISSLTRVRLRQPFQFSSNLLNNHLVLRAPRRSSMHLSRLSLLIPTIWVLLLRKRGRMLHSLQAINLALRKRAVRNQGRSLG